MTLNNIGIKTRLTLLTTVSAVLLATVGLLGISAMSETGNDLKNLYLHRLVPASELSDVVNHMQAARTQVLLSLQHDPASTFAAMHDHPLSRHLATAREEVAQAQKAWREYEQSVTLNEREERALMKQFDQHYATLQGEGIEPALRLLEQGRYHDANAVLLQKINPSCTAANDAMKKLMTHQLDSARADYDAAMALHDTMGNWMIALLALGIGINVVLAVVTVRSIGAAVTVIDRETGRLADGDLRAHMDLTGRDELAHIAAGFNRMAINFRNTVQQLTSATAQLASAAEETSAVTRDANSGIMRQQAETEQVATAMNQMNATVHEVAKSATQAAHAAHAAEAAATDGKRVVGQTIEVIDGLARDVEQAAQVIRNLAQESDNIGTVLDVIRGIAEQTNLLALNAAIEAARAGEQGRGFAVVADEVRTLASRTQQSTQEIQGMIQRLQSGSNEAVKAMDKSLAQAQAGVGQAAATGTTLDTIVASVKTINDMNTQIASASEEQSAVAEEINKNITNISDVAQQTAAGANQTATASQELARLAEELQALVGRFKL